MVDVLLDMDALARGQTDLSACWDGIGLTIGVDSHVRFVVDFFVGQAVVTPDQRIATATIDDIPGLEPAEVVGGILAFLQVEEFLSVDLGILVCDSPVAIADGNEAETHFVKIAHAVVGDVPAQLTVSDLVVLVSDMLPLLWRKVTEGGR